MAKKNILIVEDEEDILKVLLYNFSKTGFNVSFVDSGEKALQEVSNQKPDIIILDIMLPGLDGLSVCKQLKSDDKTSDIPILLLTAQGGEEEIVNGFDNGADDYVTKPFSPKVLIARVSTLLRKAHKNLNESEQLIKINNILIDPSKYVVLIDDQSVQLTISEFDILCNFAKNPGRVFTRNQIVDKTKGSNYSVTDRSVDVQIVGLRKKLGLSGKLIETVRGIGYRLKES